MAKLKLGGTVPLIIMGVVGIIIIDHFVLKGRLGIAGWVNRLIGELKKMGGVGAGPITPAPLGEGMEPPEPRTPEEMEESFAQEMEMEAESLAKYPD